MPNFRALLLSAVVLASAVTGNGWAQQPPINPGPAARASDVPSTDAYRTANQAMIQGKTNLPYTGDADYDFVAQMTPLYQGAVDVAKVELQYGKDPELRKLAQSMVYSQQAQLNFMRTWLQTHQPARTSKQ
ncbi:MULTISPECIES: DUF305 domain-containing protein [unclassified Caballeronia]|jgi:uncharacterized protein (DUF305 family)|uniref:DUF305 domain-containing protein n=1 Tax=unclassified Caballeronia TaxID=2646786 RepID=UPI0020287977|nr:MULTISPECIES: DUF305 domain-containing protein [unclassified Caballeronia]